VVIHANSSQARSPPPATRTVAGGLGKFDETY
jgi:hypothetical protein